MDDAIEWLGLAMSAAALAGFAVSCAAHGGRIEWSRAERLEWAAGALVTLALAGMCAAAGVRAMGGQN